MSKFTRTPRTAFEHAVARALGDWLGNGYNNIERCKQCKGFHEEPHRVLKALTGWPCTRIAKYHTEVFDRCLSASKFSIAYGRFRRLAPHWRIGGHLGARYGDETDNDYYDRMVALEKSKPDWDLLLHNDEAGNHAPKRSRRAKTRATVPTRHRPRRKSPNRSKNQRRSRKGSTDGRPG